MKIFTTLEISIFEYLNELRRSGVTNMFGATPYIIEEFNISEEDAKNSLKTWMVIFDEDGYDNLPVQLK